MPQRDRKGTPKRHPGGSKALQKNAQEIPRGTPKSSKMVPGAPEETPKNLKAGFARDSSESIKIEVELQYSHEKTSIQKVIFSEIFAERRSRSSLALIRRGPKKSAGLR